MPPRGRGRGDDPLTRAHHTLTAAVAALVEGDAWHQMLQVAARFPRYSPNNVLLIAAQRPDASTVAGLRTWNTLGRRVRKGEHGIAILAPCTYRHSAEDTSGSNGAQAAHPSNDSGPEAGEQRVLRGFRVVHVFDITQTEGTPLPDESPSPLTGGEPSRLWDRMQQLAKADGYRVERGPCGGAYGFTRYSDRVVRVRADVAPAQAAKTLAHEIGHIRADHETRFARDYHRSTSCRGTAEVEAESIAYIVAAVAGLDTTTYTVPYIAHWAGGNTAALRDTAHRVLETARQILHDANITTPDLVPARPGAWRPTAMAHSAGPEPNRGVTP